MEKRFFVVNLQGMVIFAAETEREAPDFKSKFYFGDAYEVKELIERRKWPSPSCTERL